MKTSHHHPNRAMGIRELEDRRLQAGRYFKAGKTAYFVEKRFSVSSTTAREWKKRWQDGTLKAQKQGLPSKLSDQARDKLAQKILRGPEAAGYHNQLWTIQRITSLIHKDFNIKYKPRSVWHLLHALGFSCQRPERKPRERNEKAIREWRLKKWPAILKKGLYSKQYSVS